MSAANNLVEDMARLLGSRAEAQQVYDLATHAHTEAMKTLERVCNTAPDELKLYVITLSLKMVGMSVDENMALVKVGAIMQKVKEG